MRWYALSSGIGSLLCLDRIREWTRLWIRPSVELDLSSSKCRRAGRRCECARFRKVLRDMHGRWRMGVEHLGSRLHSRRAFRPIFGLRPCLIIQRTACSRLRLWARGRRWMSSLMERRWVTRCSPAQLGRPTALRWMTHCKPAAFDCIQTSVEHKGMRPPPFVMSELLVRGPRPFPKLNLNSKRLCRPIPDHLFVSPQVGH